MGTYTFVVNEALYQNRVIQTKIYFIESNAIIDEKSSATRVLANNLSIIMQSIKFLRKTACFKTFYTKNVHFVHAKCRTKIHFSFDSSLAVDWCTDRLYYNPDHPNRYGLYLSFPKPRTSSSLEILQLYSKLS